MSIINFEEFVKAEYGTFTHNGSGTITVNAHAIVVDTTSAITSIKVNGSAVNVISDYISGATTEPCMITCNRDSFFSELIKTSGQVTIIKKKL